MIVKNVTVLLDFADGTLAGAFTDLGYPVRWKRGERRDLPKEVVDRVTKSGGIITIADDDAPESRIVEGAEPAQVDLQALYRKLYGKVSKQRVVFPEGFRDGTLANELAAIGHPPEFGVGEISELPLSLIDKLVKSGAFLTNDSETIRQNESQQGKHQLKIRQWQEEAAETAKRKKAKQEANEHNQSTLAEIERLSFEWSKLDGKSKTRDALWMKIEELRQSLK